MNITLRTSDFELAIENAAYEEGLDTLALLINSGVIPALDDFEAYIEDEEDGLNQEDLCGEHCGCNCENQDEEEDKELSPEDAFSSVNFFFEILNDLNKVIEEATKVEEKEKEEEKQPSKEELHGILSKALNSTGILF